MHVTRRALLLTFPALHAARAQLPDRPLRLIIPFAAGGPADLFGRVFAEALAAQLARPVIPENRSGAGGLTGLDLVAKSAPDGTVLALSGAGAMAIAPAMPVRLPLDVMADLAHLTLVVRVPEVLVVPASGHPTLAALLADARAHPGVLTYGSAGVGSITQLATALLAREADVELTHIPYRGAAPAATDLLAGRLTMLTADVPVLRTYIEAGSLRPLAVTTASRVASLPTVPTTAELGLPRVNSDNWYGLAAPAATPPATQSTLHTAALAALRAPALTAAFARAEGTPSPMDRPAYLDFLRAEAARWAPLVRASGADTL